MFGRFRAPARQKFHDAPADAAGTVAPDGGCSRMETPSEYRKYAEECRRLAGKADAEKRRAILEERTWRRWRSVVSLSRASREKRPIGRGISKVSGFRYRSPALARCREVLARRRLYPRPAATILAPFATWPPWFACPPWRARGPSIALQTSDTRGPPHAENPHRRLHNATPQKG